MSDVIAGFVPRSFRADRRLIAQLTSDPQLIRYIESLGIDNATEVPDFLDRLLALIMEAAEIATASQGTANNAASLAQQALEQAQAPGESRSLQPLVDAIELVASQLAQVDGQALRGFLAKLDDIEAMLLDSRPPVAAALPAPVVSQVTAAHAVPATLDTHTVVADATAGVLVVTLTDGQVGQVVYVKKVDAGANAVQVASAGGIDGAPSISLGALNQSVMVQFIAPGWIALG